MKKVWICVMAIFVVGLVVCLVCMSLPPSKGKVRELIHKEAATVLSYEETGNPLITSMIDNVEVSVEDVKRDSDGYVATCKVGNYNFKVAYEKCMTEEYTSTLNQFTTDFVNALVQEEKIYSTVEIKIKKDGIRTYQAKLTEQNVNAMTGGFISFCANYYENIE